MRIHSELKFYSVIFVMCPDFFSCWMGLTHHKYASDLLNHTSVYKVTPYSYSQHEDDSKVKHHSLKRYTVQPVMGDEEYQVQGSSTYIIKPWFDLAQRNTSPFTSLKWIRKKSSLLQLQTVEEAGGAQVHAALMDVYTTHYQPPEPRNHMLPARSALTAAAKLP